MREYLQGFMAGNLTINPTSWHAKMYHYWRKSAKFKTVGYMENLCHYVRVVLFWAPLMWVRRGKILKLPVWSYAVTSIVGATLWISLTLWPKVTLEVLEGIGTFLLGVGVGLGLLYAYDRNPKRVLKVGKVLTVPIWGLFYLAFEGLVRLYEKYEDGFNRLGRWIITANIRTVIRPWTVPIVAGLVVWGILDIEALAEFLATIFGIALIIGIGLGIVFLIDFISERRKERSGSNPPPQPSYACRQGYNRNGQGRRTLCNVKEERYLPVHHVRAARLAGKRRVANRPSDLIDLVGPLKPSSFSIFSDRLFVIFRSMNKVFILMSPRRTKAKEYKESCHLLHYLTIYSIIYPRYWDTLSIVHLGGVR